MKILAIAIMCAAIPAAANAQENLKKAIDNFVNDADLKQYNTGSSAQDYNNGENNKTTSFVRQYDYSLPHDKMQALTKLIAAFDKDKGKAYSVYTRNENQSDETLATVAYGDKLERSMLYGSFKDRNYRLMFVHDEQDSLRRYAYALVWWKDMSLGLTNVHIDEFYSLDPQKSRTIAEPYSKRIITINPDGSVYVNNKMTGESKLISTDIEKDTEIKTDFDFLKRFGTLRATFVSPDLAAQTTMQTMIATKIAELCNDHGDLLSTEERDFCIDALKELKKHNYACYDKYISGLFDIAISKLKNPVYKRVEVIP